MPKVRDYYEVLGGAGKANQKEISGAFRKLARKHHPELNAGDKQAEAKVKEVSEAHDVLHDPKKRSLYDQYGPDWAAAQAGRAQPGARGGAGGFRPDAGPSVQYRTVTPEEMDDLFGSEGGFGDIFGSIFGANRGRSRQQAIDVEAPITVSLSEVYRSTSRTVELPGGRRVEVKVPAGVKEGTVLRVPGLRAKVQIAPDPVFRREGKDLYVTVPVALHMALQGGDVAAPSLKGGLVHFKVPPETQNGPKIRPRRLGFPDPKGGPTRDLYAEVRGQPPVPLPDPTPNLPPRPPLPQHLS